jgi:SAM-dependent methyltransferase
VQDGEGDTALERWQVETIDWEERDNRRFTLEYTAPLLSRLIGPPSAGGAVLSVGCGVGSDVETLAGLGWDAHGVEPGYRHEAWSRRTCPQRLHLGDGRRLPFDDGRFDAVTSYGVIEHIGAIGDSVEVGPDFWEQRVRYARELARVTRPGGAIVLSTPNKLFPFDFFHSTNRYGVRPHSPREAFSVSYGEIERLFVGIAGCRAIRPLGLAGGFVFRRSREHLWGRMLVPVARGAFTALGWRALAPVARSPVNPFLIVHVTR